MVSQNILDVTRVNKSFVRRFRRLSFRFSRLSTFSEYKNRYAFINVRRGRKKFVFFSETVLKTRFLMTPV